MRRVNKNWFTALIALASWGVAIADSSAETTFTKEIAPIIFQNCTSCHRPGQAAPFSLQNYADVKKRGELISDIVERRLMPPWKADRGDVSFRHDRRLNDTQVQQVVNWIKSGMPEGNPIDLPPLPEFTPGWSLGEPDLIVKMNEPYRVPADGPDIYRNFVIPLNLEEERWVKAVDFRPSARSVVHHSLFFFESAGRARKLDEEDETPGFKGGMGAIMRLRGGAPGKIPRQTDDNPNTENRGFRGLLNRQGDSQSNDPPALGGLGGWALGAQPHALPDGLAFRLPAGSDLVLATHFHPSGKPEDEASTVGLYFSDRPTTRRFTHIQLPPAFGAFKGIDIPAGAKEYVIEDTFELPIDVEAFGIGAHAHYLGKSMVMTATLPNGDNKTLLSIPDWDFAWQEQYQFENYVFLPKGTVLHSRVTYDNSADNPRNPTNPPARVRFGEESTNEMGCVTMTVVAANESELPELQEAFRQHFRSSLMKTPLLKMIEGRLGRK